MFLRAHQVWVMAVPSTTQRERRQEKQRDLETPETMEVIRS